MATEREYREWQRRKKKQFKRRQKSSITRILGFFIVFLSVAITIANNPDWLSFIPEQNNSLKSLTKDSN